MKNKDLQVIIAQLDFLVGDIDGNTDQILQAAQRARSKFQADLIVFPELTLTGYPPEDLLLRPSIQVRVEKALHKLRSELPRDLYVLIGYPRRLDGGALFNAAGLILNGELIAEYHKQELPNFQVFDEKRYFHAGSAPCVVDILGTRVAITICEDIWHVGPVAQAKAAGAELVLNLNASPFHLLKEKERASLLRRRAEEGGMPILYANLVRSEEHTSELQSQSNIVCRLLLEKKN